MSLVIFFDVIDICYSLQGAERRRKAGCLKLSVIVGSGEFANFDDSLQT